MSQSRSPLRGLVYVPMSLSPELSVQECDDWYNNEHVPIRMRLSYFEQGYRYRAVKTTVPGSRQGQVPEWLAIYDVGDMWQLLGEPYQRLLGPDLQSSREKEILQKLSVSRRYYDLVATYQAPEFRSLEDRLRQGEMDKAYQGTLIVVGVRLTSDSPEAEREWDRWYEEDHLPPLRTVPGWQRTRRYRASLIQDAPKTADGPAVEYLTLNEFAEDGAIGGPEHQVAIRTETQTSVVSSKWRQSYKLHYVQGTASRDLAALARGDSKNFLSPHGLTRTISGHDPVIESYASTEDGMVIPYRLEGAVQQGSPVLVLCTSACLSWDIWDQLVKSLRSTPMGGGYQILRLVLPTRPQDADQALNIKVFPTQRGLRDLYDCFEALRMSRASLILSSCVGGPTAARDSTVATKHNRKGNDSELSKLCDSGLFVVCPSQRKLTEVLEVLESTAGNHLRPEDWIEKASEKILGFLKTEVC